MTRLETQRRLASIHAQLVEKLGEMERLNDEIAALEAEARNLGSRLSVTNRSGNDVSVNTTIERRIALSAAAHAVPKAKQFLEIAKPARQTMGSIAEDLGCTRQHLTLCLVGKNKMRQSWALRIQDLTRSEKYPAGFAATAANWPAGWSLRDP